MIVLFHVLYVMASSLFTLLSTTILKVPHSLANARTNKQDQKEDELSLEPKLIIDAKEPRKSYVQDMEPIVGLQFIPPVYAQRYMAVQEILADQRWNGSVKKVVDFGCAEFGFFKYVKHVQGVEEILTVDIDEELLNRCKCRAAPLTSDYLSNRNSPLRVQVFVGSIAKHDPCLLGTDAVVCIEIIEHLWPDEVEAVPYTVFGFIKPQVAIFTTPNSDFNVLFTNFTGFRHLDHKFEWSRDQFECWAHSIVSRYPDYEVSFQGIGAGPPGTEAYGHCSQMAVFVKQTPAVPDGYLKKVEDAAENDVFTKVCEYVYPFRVDERTNDEKILHEAEYDIRLYGYNNQEFCNDESITEVPISMLMPDVEKWCTSKEKLIALLEGNGWELSFQDPSSPAVIYPHFSDHSSDSSFDDDVEEATHSSTLLPDLVDEIESKEGLDGDDEIDWTSGDNADQMNQENWEEEMEVNSFVYPEKLFENGSGVLELTQKNLSLSPCVGQNGSLLLIEESEQNLKLDVIPSKDPNPSQNKTIVGHSEASELIQTAMDAPKKAYHLQSNNSLPITDPSGKIVPNGFHDEPSKERQHVANDGWFRGLDVPCSSSMSSNKSLDCDDSGSNPFYKLFPLATRQDEMSDSLFVNASSDCELAMHDLDSSSDDCNYVEHSRSEQDMDLDLSLEHSDEELSDGDIDNHAVLPNPRVLHHRDHFPFGMNDVVVENGDVANNNRDGEGNNAVALIQEILLIDLVPEVEEFLNNPDDNEEEEYEDIQNDNNDVFVPHVIHPFPPWLLNLIDIINHGGPEMGGGGEPNGHV